MKENYLNQYQDEISESSIVNEDENISEITTKNSGKTGASSGATRSQNKFTPYTFDPKSVLRDTQPKATTGMARPYSIPAVESKYSAGNMKTNYVPSYTQMRAPQPDMSFLTTLGDNVTECRKTDEYKAFAKEFEKQYGNDQREMERVTKDLNNRSAKLDNFMRELQGADLDMILYRNRLVRELQDVQNDLKEASNNILVLMTDRSTMRDQFCIFKMKIKKLKGFVKTYQEDIQA